MAANFTKDTGGTLTNGLIRAYLMEGNANDATGNSNGTGTSVAYNSSYGKRGQGVQFTPTSGVISTSSISQSNSAFTISLWAKRANEIGSGGQLFWRDNNTNENVSYQLDYSYNGGTRIIRINRGRRFVTDINASYNVTLGTANYNHFLVTWNSPTMTLYYNGSNVASLNDSGSSGSANPGQGFGIGNDMPTNNTSAWDGYIDEVYAWNRVLTATEISDLYNSGSGSFFTSTNLKSLNGLAKASIKSINGLALANIKSVNGVT